MACPSGDYLKMKLLVLLRLLRQEDRMDARHHSTGSDGDPRHELVNLIMTMTM